jgi:hypothetical protein
VISVQGNPLSEQVISRLQEEVSATTYQGPVISFGMAPGVAATGKPAERSLAEIVTDWYISPRPENHDPDVIEKWNQQAEGERSRYK